MHILLVEDEPKSGDYLRRGLTESGFVVDWVQTGVDGLHNARTLDYKLIILDVMLPGMNGWDILRELRRTHDTPVLFLTARDEVEDRVKGLELGADDYLVKPFDFRELDARIRVLLRRSGGESTNLLHCANLSIDRKSRSATLDGQPIELTRREVTLLEIIAARPGRIFNKDELMDRLFTVDDNPSANSVEQYVARLRKKLAAAAFEIRTLRGLGYQLVLHAPAEPGAGAGTAAHTSPLH